MADFNHLIKMGYKKREIIEAIRNSDDIRSAMNYVAEMNQANVNKDTLKASPRKATMLKANDIDNETTIIWV